MTRLVQLQNRSKRAVALVDEPHLCLLTEFDSVYQLASNAEARRASLRQLVQEAGSSARLEYDEVYSGKSDWQLLPPLDHPTEPARCLVTGTGLTHLGSAKNRQAMHSGKETELTDSMKIFKWGLEKGKPPAGQIGIAPEWFYKGCGTILRAHQEPLEVPFYAEDGGEEAEVAGLYYIGTDGMPWRLGLALGNEFSDHEFEKKNYLNLAGSKLRTCSLGPELVLDHEFQSVPGKVTIERSGQLLWSQEILTGEKEMCHSLANIEHHHFKFEAHRRPGDVHIHYFGACSLSFGAKIRLAAGDVMEVAFNGFGRPLRNPLREAPRQAAPIAARSMG